MLNYKNLIVIATKRDRYLGTFLYVVFILKSLTTQYRMDVGNKNLE